MKPKEKKDKIVYRIIDKSNGEALGSYSRAAHDQYDFESVDDARGSNCHEMFEDKTKYKVAKYKITYTLIDSDCDNAGID